MASPDAGSAGERLRQLLAVEQPEAEQVGCGVGRRRVGYLDPHRPCSSIDRLADFTPQRKAPMPSTVILGTARTPFGKMGGALSSLDATELGGTAIAAALERSSVDPEQVEHVSYGQVLQAGQGQIPSRQAQIKAGIPKEVPSETVNKVCASGMRSIGLVDQSVRLGEVGVAVAGGMESMSGAPYLLPQARFGFRMGDAKAIDAMTHDGLTNPFSGKHMMQEANEVAERARADPARPRPLGRALAPARRQGDRRGPARRRDRRA